MAVVTTKSKAVLVTTEVPVQTGGIGTFIWNLATLLKSHGHDVLVILANPTSFSRKVWAKQFDEAGIRTSYVFNDHFTVPDGYSWHKRVSEVVSGMIPDDTDVVYLADWQAKGFDFVRKRRFSRTPGPAVVTVLHGCGRWLREGMRTVATSEEELYLDFAEAYTAQHSDYVVSPGAYMESWVRSAGWKLPQDSGARVLNLPFFPPIQREGGPMQVVSQQATVQMTTLHAERATLTTTTINAPTAMQLIEETLDYRASNLSQVAIAHKQEPMRHHATVDTGAQSLVRLRPVFRRIVFFGRIETRKGIELFFNGLTKIKGQPCMQEIEEIVLLGGPSANPFGVPDDAASELARRLDHKVNVRAISNLNTFQAQQFLAERASDTLVVVPSLRENFPLSVIETSLIPGLNILASNAGSISEILGPKSQDRLFEPFLAPFARKLEETLLAGPKDDDELGHYEWARANDEWLAFHEEAVAFSRARAFAGNERMSVSLVGDLTMPSTDQSVDVCVSYYNLGTYLPYMLKSLERQTVEDFNVIVVNDGSTDAESIRAFEEQAMRYANRPHWKFITTPNGGLSAARNAAAAAGSGRYLIFIDADDVVAPMLVERFRTAIQISGDDCLTCYMHLFRGEGWNEAYAHSAVYSYTPSGPDPVLGLVSNPFGGACCIVKREAFDAVSGFSTDVSRYVGFEDYEFYLKLMLDGFSLDALPDYLLYYRVRDEGMFRTNDLYENRARILRTYERKLQQLGFPGLATLAAGLFQQRDANTNPSASNTAVDSNYLVYHVSGHLVWKALRLKLRNQIAKRFGRPPRGE